jgi:hypothetical protein
LEGQQHLTVLVFCALSDIVIFMLAGLKRRQRENCCGCEKGCHDVAVAMNKRCCDVGLRKQHLGYHNSCFVLLVWFWVLHCVGVGSAY